MITPSKRLILLILSLILISALALFLFFRPSDTSVDMEAVKEMIETQYGTEPVEIRLVDDVYYALIERADGMYEIEISQETGTILSLIPIEKDDEEVEELLSESEARERVLGLAPADAEIQTLSLLEDTPSVWRAEIESEQGEGEIEIQAQTGEELVNTFSEPEQTAYISIERATEIALGEVDDGVVDDVELEDSNGRMVYEVDIENEETDVDVKVIIDAITGQIIQFEY